jgi:hypothetical protein
MIDEERLAWLRLARTEQVGPVAFENLLGRYGSARAVMEALPDLASRAGRNGPLRSPPLDDARRELAAGERIGARLHWSCEPAFPYLLAALDPEKKARKKNDEDGESDLDKRIREVERVLAEARPAPHMLRDGGIEHEADLILGTHNPAADLAWCKEKKKAFIDVAWPRNPTPLDVGVLKNRSGSDGDWIRLLGDYGAGHFTSGTGAASDHRPEAQVGTTTFEEWSPPEDHDANPYG